MWKLLGGLSLLMGLALGAWVVFALVSGPTPETQGRSPLPPLVFSGALIGCGIHWLRK